MNGYDQPPLSSSRAGLSPLPVAARDARAPLGGPEKTRANADLRASWYRRDWAKVVLGLLAIAAVIYFVSEAIMIATGVHPTDRATHWAYNSRDLAAMLTAALWVAWRALRAEQKLAAAGERVRLDEARLVEEHWRMEQAEGLAAFSRVLAHELRNPLHALTLHGTVVKRAAEHLPSPEGERLRAAADVLHEQTERMGSLLDDYLEYGKAAELHIAPQALALDVVAAEAVAARQAAFDERGVSVCLRGDSALPLIHGDRTRLMQAIHHLIQHALDALPRGSHVDLAVQADGGQVVLQVTDDGPGFPDPEAVFRPFFTSGTSGSGLGFAVVRDIVRAHRGEVAARNVGERGAQVDIRLPVGEAR